MNHYVVLGIAEDADEETIRSAFRVLARRYHPDVGAGSSPGEFQRAREAYEALADPDRRRRYDQQLRDSRARTVVVRQVIVSPSAEPVFSSRRSSFGVPNTWVRVTRSSSFDDLVEELFRSFGDHWSSPLRRRW